MGPGQAVREDPGPREHRAEGDDLEQGQVDRRGHEQPRAGEEEHEHQRGGERETLGQPVEKERGGQQERRETEDHHSGDLVVQVFVGVERNAPDEGQIHADHGEEECGGGGGAAASCAPPETPQITPHAHRVDHDERPADFERGVEECRREVVEGAELAEVELPPRRVARGEDRGEDAADEHDEDEPGEVHGGDRVDAPGETPRDGGQDGGGDGGTDRNAHFGHFRRGRVGCPPTPRDPQPPSAHSGLSRGNDGPRSPRRRRNPSREW